MAKEENQKNAWVKVGGYLYVGCILLFVGIGFIVDNIAAFSIIGVGVGFFALAAAYILGSKKSTK